MPSPRKPDRIRRAAGWLWPMALLALAPKCLLCVLAYAGLGAALGLGGPELCGAPSGSSVSWPTALAWFGAAVSLLALGWVAWCRRAALGQPMMGCSPTVD